MIGAYGTNFAESEALLAVVAEDTDAAEQVLSGMTVTELRSLAESAQELRDMARAMARIKVREAKPVVAGRELDVLREEWDAARAERDRLAEDRARLLDNGEALIRQRDGVQAERDRLDAQAQATLSAYQRYLDTDDLDVLRDALTGLMSALDGGAHAGARPTPPTPKDES